MSLVDNEVLECGRGEILQMLGYGLNRGRDVVLFAIAYFSHE